MESRIKYINAPLLIKRITWKNSWVSGMHRFWLQIQRAAVVKGEGDGYSFLLRLSVWDFCSSSGVLRSLEVVLNFASWLQSLRDCLSVEIAGIQYIQPLWLGFKGQMVGDAVMTCVLWENFPSHFQSHAEGTASFSCSGGCTKRIASYLYVSQYWIVINAV